MKINLPSSKQDILTIIPHKGKMALLDRVLEYGEKPSTLTAECDITEACLFYDAALDGIPSWVVFEFMAQGIAALSGIMNRARGIPQPGFILSVNGLKTHIPIIRGGSTVGVRVLEDTRMDSVFTFLCTAFLGQEEIAHARLTVIEQMNNEIFTL